MITKKKKKNQKQEEEKKGVTQTKNVTKMGVINKGVLLYIGGLRECDKIISLHNVCRTDF
jgi:hypothetical protein